MFGQYLLFVVVLTPDMR